MTRFLAATFRRLASWLDAKSAPAALTGAQWSGTSFVDAYKRNRNPTPNELLAELKATAWTCASLNAQVCASYPPSLYVVTQPQPAAGPSASRSRSRRRRPTASAPCRGWPCARRAAATIEEVTDHPLLTLLKRPNPVHNSFDLWELTTLYQEVHGAAYWFLDMDPVLGVPPGDLDPAQPERDAAPRAGQPQPRGLLHLPHRDEGAAFPAGPDHPLPLPRPARPVHRRPVPAAGLLRAGGR